MRAALFAICAVTLNLGCAAVVKLHDGQGLNDANLVKLRVDGAMTLARAVVVRRVDDEWGRQGGVVGSYFNDKSTWGAKIDLPAGQHEIEATYKNVLGVIFNANFESQVTYGIEPVDGKPNCLRLTSDRGQVVQEQCYVEPPVEACTNGEAHLVFSQKEAKAQSGKDTRVFLQKVDGKYGPNSASFGWGLNFYNDKDTHDLDVRVCAGRHTLLFGVDIEGYRSIRPLTLKPDLEAHATYRVGLLDSGIQKPTFLFTTHSTDIEAVLLFLEKIEK